MSSDASQSTPPFAPGDVVKTTYFFLDSRDPNKTYKVAFVRKYKYAQTGWMVALDDEMFPELDARWFSAA